jgi:hypothetical protein
LFQQSNLTIDNELDNNFPSIVDNRIHQVPVEQIKRRRQTDKRSKSVLFKQINHPNTQTSPELAMPCQESIADAKAAFVTAVSDGISTLMQQCGYSRDRAASALMRELSRGGDSTRPNDDEVS